MGFTNKINIFPLILIVSLLTSCVTTDNGVEQEQIDKPFIPTQDNEIFIGATLTPFLPEPAQILFVNDDAAIQAALAEKLGVSGEGLQVTFAENTGSHAKGEVRDEYFLAYKDNNSWIIVYAGLANPPCQDVIASQFPAEMVPECVDEENNLVVRVGETEAAATKVVTG